MTYTVSSGTLNPTQLNSSQVDAERLPWFTARVHLYQLSCRKSFVSNFMKNTTVEEFWKSANISTSYEWM